MVEAMKTMEKEIKETSIRPCMENECFCDLCRKFKETKVNAFLRVKQVRQNKMLEEALNGTRRKSCLSWILKRLTLPANKIVTRGLNVFVSQTCFYQDGEMSSFFMNKDMLDSALRQIPKERLTATFFQKTFNERRWRYREKVLAHKKEFGKIDYKESIVIQFVDGYEKLIGQSQFSTIMQKRRQDPYWTTISSFKNFISLNKRKQGGIIIRYQQGDEIDHSLFQRATTMIRVLATNILKHEQEYIRQQDQQAFCRRLIQDKDDQTLFKYMTYKVVKFIQKFYDTKITKGNFQWVVDQLQRPVLLDVFRVKHEDLIKYDWTLEEIQKRLNADEEQLFYDKQIPDLNPESQVVSSKIQRQMRNTFEDLKEHYGLSLKEEVDHQQIKNQQYFERVYPDLEVDLDNLRLMDIPTFRRKYLRDKPKKKPLVSQFKSTMIRALHNSSPKKGRYRIVSAQKPSTPLDKTRTISFKNSSTRVNSGRSTMYNGTTYNTAFFNGCRSINIFDL